MSRILKIHKTSSISYKDRNNHILVNKFPGDRAFLRGRKDLDEIHATEKIHRVEVFQREQIRLQGVVHVESFDEREVVVETDLGLLNLTGAEFHITSLDLDKGYMVIEGMFLAMEYSGMDSRSRPKDKGFLQRLFR